MRMGLFLGMALVRGELKLPDAKQKRASDRYRPTVRWHVLFLFSSGYNAEERLAY